MSESIPLGLPDNVEQDPDGSMYHVDCPNATLPVEVWDEEIPDCLSCGGCGLIWHWRNGHWLEDQT